MATDQPPALIIGLVVLLTLASGAAGLLFYYRGFAVTGAARRLWLMLASLLGGGVGWTAHYGCVLVLLPLTQAYAFAPWAMLLSLVLDASCLMVSIRAAQTVGPRWNVVVMALTLSAIISVSNYISIRSIRVPGELSIDLSTLWLGFLACFALSHAGAILVARLRGVGKSAAGALLLALGSPAFDLIVLGGMDLRLDPAAAAPQGLAPSEMLAGLVLGLGVLLTSVTVASVYVDKQIDAVANARYREMALTDPLTGAPSRAAMTERLHDLFQNLEGNAASGDAARSVAVLAIDLNRFKPINDVHGHAAGDALLAAISERCIAVLKDGETFGRMGGDEFLALKSPLGSDAEINAFARRLIAEIERPVQHGGVTLSVGVSIGWCRAPEHATEPAAALNRADLALYRAKTRGQVQRYEPAMDEPARARAALQADLVGAEERRELELFFQPQVSLPSGRLSGFEALIRWRHPVRGLVAPGEFIPAAEENGQINAIGAWALHHACTVAARWPERLSIAVNVAPRQLLEDGFLEVVQDALMASRLDPARLEIELTEATVIDDLDRAREVVDRLKEVGARIALDDYGSGYASLSLLRSLPFDKIKIDRSFIDALDDDKQAAAIVRSTLVLGRSLSIPVLAEGVETADHAGFLMAEGCQEVQGYHFGRPLPLDDAEALIAEDDLALHARAGAEAAAEVGAGGGAAA